MCVCVCKCFRSIQQEKSLIFEMYRMNLSEGRPTKKVKKITVNNTPFIVTMYNHNKASMSWSMIFSLDHFYGCY